MSREKRTKGQRAITVKKEQWIGEREWKEKEDDRRR